MRRIIIAGILSMVGLLMLILGSRVLFKKSGANRIEAINNSKRAYLTLIDFDSDHGKFPDASTIAAVKAHTSTSLPLGTSSSNEIFRQLIAVGIRTERIYWAKSAITPRTPDEVTHGSRALQKGECAFAYVAGLSSSSSPDTPLLLTPVDPAKRCFERRSDYSGKAVILFVDGSAKSFPVNKHGQVEINGMDLFDPRQPFWGGKAPDIKWPE